MLLSSATTTSRRARTAPPSISTISPDKKLIAETAVSRLLFRIGKDANLPGVDITASHKLIVRESTAGRSGALTESKWRR